MSEQHEYLIRDRADAELALARVHLAHRQERLLAALVAAAPPPPGFDPEQLRVQAEGLRAKRRETVGHLLPELPELLGPDFAPLFARYAAGRPLTGGYRADALAFAEWALAAEPAARWQPALRRLLRPAASRWGRLLPRRARSAPAHP
ncbi:hypothetical protein KSE_55170 [Kitasatospora setae KM-6054]|uniref:SCO6045-like C-terminal domain-containing protein n=1 Tax=Kitasatospora setae (strain ATCC 33774 / DSM 43861 / JCM 3304 / KCC A-0304 / NBRC 14216 / KM-6054) TaxID=452652 RepID=E4NIG2_KITSK|nr:hypothetical protein KSE_55170 [Kitasatospora setae KM-6054]